MHSDHVMRHCSSLGCELQRDWSQMLLKRRIRFLIHVDALKTGPESTLSLYDCHYCLIVTVGSHRCALPLPLLVGWHVATETESNPNPRKHLHPMNLKHRSTVSGLGELKLVVTGWICHSKIQWTCATIWHLIWLHVRATVDPRDVVVFLFCFCEKVDKPSNEWSAWSDYTASMIEVAQKWFKFLSWAYIGWSQVNLRSWSRLSNELAQPIVAHLPGQWMWEGHYEDQKVVPHP